MPSGGRLESGELVRMMIQCESSHFLSGITKFPLKVAPASNRMTSPQDAPARTCCRSCPEPTVQVLPPAGVLRNELFTYSLGNSAGPSKCLPLDEGDWSAAECAEAEIDKKTKAIHKEAMRPAEIFILGEYRSR